VIGRRPRVALIVALLAIVASGVPGRVRPVAAADPYTLESVARYQIRTEQREIGVRVELEFTNTTPNPPGRFSIFEDIRLAVHAEASELAASDDQGALTVSDGFRRIDGHRVHVAMIQLREGLRYNDSVDIELTYVLPDGEGGGHLRVRPSVAIFPAWSFGTSGAVRVAIPSGYEMRVDGDPLTEVGDTLVSGTIEDPAAWLALVTAVAPAELASHEATVPLEGGTADLVVRAFTDDEEWGRRTLDAVSAALPLIEAELGLPYPLRGQLILVESVPATTAGFGESSTTGAEIPVSFDQPPFTALHQVAHAWLPPSLVESRWISEGLASQVAAAVGSELDIEPPFDATAEGEAHADAAFPLDAWSSAPDPEADAYGYAASWAFLDEITEAAGAEAIPSVLARVASSIGSYEPAEVAPEPVTDGASDPAVPLTSRTLLDHLENVTDADLAPLFAERVFGEADTALLGPRADARESFDALVASAEGWGAPDPVAAAMADWRFDEAVAQIEDARAWLADRDDLLEQMSDAGLSAPDRLRQAYRAYGGGAEAESELESERDVVEAYVAAAARVNAERSLIERLGLVGGQDPDKALAMANGQFTDGELDRSVASIAAAERIVQQAATAGVVRLVSLLLLVFITIGLVIVLFRRRAYTAPR
jgi:hypothetical protein